MGLRHPVACLQVRVCNKKFWSVEPMRCNTLEFDTLQHDTLCCSCVAVHCNTDLHCNTAPEILTGGYGLSNVQHTATRCNMHCNALWHDSYICGTHCSALQHNTLQCTLQHTLQHTTLHTTEILTPGKQSAGSGGWQRHTHSATYYNTVHHKLQRTVSWLHARHTATHCNTTHCNTHCNTPHFILQKFWHLANRSWQARVTTALPQCNTLQHIATQTETHFKMTSTYARHTATHCNTLQHTATHCNTLQHTATRCNTLQHTATHCNPHQHKLKRTISWLLHMRGTLQHTATWHTATRTATPHCILWSGYGQ